MNDKADVRFEKLTIPTYSPGKPEELPVFFEKRPYQGASGKLYPLPYTTKISDEKKDVEYDAAVLENEYIRVEVLPQIGGKIQRAYDKKGDYDFIYHNKVIKPAMIGLAGPWISGGIEFNWPQHHRPTTFLPVEASIEKTADGDKTVWVGETEPFGRMRGMAGVTVRDGRSYVMAKVRVYNRTPYPQPFMWWANLAVEINDSYKIVFPPDVEYTNDHDRRAVISWPIAKGVYSTARPFDYGEGTDIHEIPAIKVASSFMVSKGQSDCDFVSGYDSGRERGVVTFADHHVSPGKKLFHWGHHAFGRQWCSNLTDDGSCYVELMTGVYTDNQPDFTWIMPYETKCFEQYWYPIREIGEVKNATLDAAVNLEVRDGRLFAGVCPSGRFDGCRIRVGTDAVTVCDATFDMAPDKPYLGYCDLPDGIDAAKLTLTVTNSDGKALVSYTPPVRGVKVPPKPRPRALPPEEIPTVEELYLNGRHLEQYKHFAYSPEAYYREGLRRDPGDSRCNTALGGLLLGRGLFEEAIACFDRAIERLTLRNFNPYETEAYYKKGLALRLLGRYGEAYDALSLSAWSYDFRSAAYYELAKLDCRRGDRAAALEKLDKSLETNSRHVLALKLRNRLTGADSGDVKALDPLDGIMNGKADYYLDEAIELMQAGLVSEAVSVLRSAPAGNPLVNYYLFALTGDGEYLKKAESADSAYCFPARLEDIAVLKAAGTPMACYYLGCLYYDRLRCDEAAVLWEMTLAALPDFAPVCRNLALYAFDRRGDAAGARGLLGRALGLMPSSDRVFYELTQLYKNSGASLSERLALHEKYPALSGARDDCTLDRAVILTQLGHCDDAAALLGSHRFHTYEGGEGGLTRHHAWLKYLAGRRFVDEGKLKEAIDVYLEGFTFPKCYGEEKNLFAQEEHLNYALGEAYSLIGDVENARKCYLAATVDYSAPSYLSLWRALAFRALGRYAEAQRLLDDMLSLADRTIADKDIPNYFGVGAPVPMPFEGDFARSNEVRGLTLRAAALIGLGRLAEAGRTLDAVRRLDPDSFGCFALGLEINR